MEKPVLYGRIRYDESFMNNGEYFVFEIKHPGEEEWGLDVAYKLIDNRLSYEALIRVREWQRLGVKFYFE